MPSFGSSVYECSASCVACFFAEVFETLNRQGKLKQVAVQRSEIGDILRSSHHRKHGTKARTSSYRNAGPQVGPQLQPKIVGQCGAKVRSVRVSGAEDIENHGQTLDIRAALEKLVEGGHLYRRRCSPI